MRSGRKNRLLPSISAWIQYRRCCLRRSPSPCRAALPQVCSQVSRWPRPDKARPVAMVCPDSGAIRFRLSVASFALELRPSSACRTRQRRAQAGRGVFSSLPISSTSPGLLRSAGGGAGGIVLAVAAMAQPEAAAEPAVTEPGHARDHEGRNHQDYASACTYEQIASVVDMSDSIPPVPQGKVRYAPATQPFPRTTGKR
jgi:hypothetical protein